MIEHFRLPLQVDFCINVSCVDGNMAQPSSDGVDIDSGAKKVSGRRMSDGVGTDRPV